jgi:hypothetical protein
MQKSLLRTIELVALVVALLFPAIWNRGPFYFIDTRTYMRSVDSALNKFTHTRTEWTAEDSNPTSTAGTLSSQTAVKSLHNIGEAHTRSLEDIKKKGIMLGRSLYYGLLLYIGAITSGFWLTIVFQAAAVLLALYLTVRALDIPVWPTLIWLCLGLCVISDVAFFASYLMPDLFAGIAILSCAVLLSVRRRLSPTEYSLWFLLLASSMIFHDTCLLISVLLLGLGVVANLFRRSWSNARGLCLILLAAITAFVGQSLVTYGIAHTTGQRPLRFPLIEARLIESGPGTAYLRATCPQSHFTLCNYVSEFPMSTYAFLFGTEPGKAVYEMASYDERRALSDEQFRFLFAVIRFDPAGFVESELRNSAAQFLNFKLSSFRYSPDTKDVMDRTFPVHALTQMRAGAAYRRSFPAPTLSVLNYLFVIGSVIYLSLALFGLLPGRSMNDSLKTVFFTIAVGVVLNAVICGGISANEARYQARVIWLIPLAALLVEAHAWFRRPDKLVGSHRRAVDPLKDALSAP